MKKNNVQHAMNVKRARRKHNPIYRKLVLDTFDYLDEEKNVKRANKYVEKRIEEWFQYCEKFQSEANHYQPIPDSFIDSMVMAYCLSAENN